MWIEKNRFTYFHLFCFECETFEERYQKKRSRQRKESESEKRQRRKRKDKNKRRGGIQKREINLIDETEQIEFEYQGIHAEKQEEKIGTLYLRQPPFYPEFCQNCFFFQ